MTKFEDILACPFHTGEKFCTSNIRLFHVLPEEAQKKLVQCSLHQERKKGSVLAEEGSSIDAIILIRKGRVKTSHIDAEGEEHILDILHEGQAIWHGMFLKDHIFHYTVTALTNVKLCLIPRTAFLEVLGESPDTAMYLIELLSTELQDANEKALLLSIRNPEARLAEFLLFRDNRCIGKEIRMKLDDIAASIGLRPETISRNISRLEQEGLIKRTGQGKILVLDREKLKQKHIL